MTASIDDQIEALWDFNDSATSESRFTEAVDAARKDRDEPRRLALMTQQARAIGLQKRFDEAADMLARVESSIPQQSDPEMAAVRVCLLLERGRVLNSSGAKEKAKPMFERAWEEAKSAGHDALAIDAAHMVAITSGAGDAALEWNRRAIELADASSDPRARRWRGSLHNNLGWTFHDRGDYPIAMHHFEQALAARLEQRQDREVLIARWCVARCRRSMKRFESALAEQLQLCDEWSARGEKDGFVFEEIAECLLALGKADEAKRHFAQAHEALKTDPWIEPERLKRMAAFSE